MFSVVVPCYGHEDYVRDAIESLFTQAAKNFEIVAVDDGSPDATGKILDSLAAASPVTMRVVHTPNRGAANALNTGASLAQAPFIAFLNDDDRYHPDRLAVFERVIGNVSSFVWGFSAVEAIDEAGSPTALAGIPDHGRRAAIEGSMTAIGASNRFDRMNVMVSSGNLVVRASSFRELGGFRDMRYMHDWDMALRLLDLSAPYPVDRQLYQYRVHGGSAHVETFQRSGSRQANREGAQMKLAAGTRRAPRYDPAGIQLIMARDLLHGDTDESKAVRAVLWGLDMLRRFPFAYRAVRAGAKSARSIRRRARRRG